MNSFGDEHYESTTSERDGQQDNLKEAYLTTDSSHYITYVPPAPETNDTSSDESEVDDDESSSFFPSGSGSIIPDSIPEIPSKSDFKTFYDANSMLVIGSGILFFIFVVTLICCCIRVKKMRS